MHSGVPFSFFLRPFGGGHDLYQSVAHSRKKMECFRHYVVLYIDDGLILADDVEACIQSIIQIRSDLKDAGFRVNEAKSCWLPAKQIRWLGFVFNREQHFMLIPTDKGDLIKSRIAAVLSANTVSAKQLAGVVDLITMLHLVLGGIVYFLAQSWIAARFSWTALGS